MKNVSRRMFLAGSGAAALGTISTLGVGAAGAAEVCKMPKKWDHTYDVIVIGAGGAGMAAGITAAEAGARTVVLEKLGFPGGNTMVSGGGMNGYVKADAEAAGMEDSAKLHAEQTLAAGDFRADPALVRQYAEKMPETVEWFKSLGIEFTPIYQIYGGLWPRCRNPQGEQGAAYTAAEVKRLKELGVEIKTNAKVTAIIRENPNEGRVMGVEVEQAGKKTYWKAEKGVVAAAGGYAYNAEMCAYFDPRFKELSTTNQPGATGEVLVAMQDVGALATGMDYIQCIPGPAPGYKSTGNLIQCIEYSIFVNKEGKRFVAEDQRRDVIRDATLAQTGGTVYPLTDSVGFAADNKYQGKRNQAALREGVLFEAATLDELAGKIGVPADALKATVAEYNAEIDSKKDPFGRAERMLAHKIETPPFYAGPIGMARHHTMGGVRINVKAQVLDRTGKVIPGLYAAGEVTGGIHGTNRVGGNALGDAFTYGRIAGASAAKGE